MRQHQTKLMTKHQQKQQTLTTLFTLSVLVSKSASTKRPSFPNSACTLVDSRLPYHAMKGEKKKKKKKKTS